MAKKRKEFKAPVIMCACKSCKSLLYLGDRTCPQCGMPAGDSVTEDDLERLYALFEPDKPEPVRIVYAAQGPESFMSYTTDCSITITSWPATRITGLR
jgi:predicted amidophosphoribosyltransferase